MLVIVMVVAVVAFVLWFQWSMAQKRLRAVAAIAAANGWAFSSRDMNDCAATPFHVFARGRRRETTNVCTFRHADGTTVHLFDYRFTEGSGRSSHTYKHSCALLVSDDRFPALTIEHESSYHGLLSAVGLEDLQFESEEFNRLFRITSDEPRFAYAVIDARMMAFLLDHPIRRLHVGLVDRFLLVWCDQLASQHLPTLAAYTTGFRSHIPAVARELYPGY